MCFEFAIRFAMIFSTTNPTPDRLVLHAIPGVGPFAASASLASSVGSEVPTRCRCLRGAFAFFGRSWPTSSRRFVRPFKLLDLHWSGRNRRSGVHQSQGFSLRQQTLAKPPYSLMVRMLINSQLQSTLSQPERCLSVHGGYLRASMLQSFQQKSAIRQDCINFLSSSEVSAP